MLPPTRHPDPRPSCSTYVIPATLADHSECSPDGYFFSTQFRSIILIKLLIAELNLSCGIFLKGDLFLSLLPRMEDRNGGLQVGPHLTN